MYRFDDNMLHTASYTFPAKYTFLTSTSFFPLALAISSGLLCFRSACMAAFTVFMGFLARVTRAARALMPAPLHIS